MKVALTFDVDGQSYVGPEMRAMPDELDVALEALGPVFDRHRDWRATWFLRIDPEVDMYEQQVRALRGLVERGHRVGWHYHGPLAKVAQFARSAQRRGLEVSRIGFGRGSNAVMRALVDAGFTIDSTAMPRPKYPWTPRGVDWTTTPSIPFHPSVADYRVPGSPALQILEIPISCAEVRAEGDNQRVVRYLNPAYHPAMFDGPVGSWVETHDQLVTITHPYEVLGGVSHGLLAFDPKAFEQNVMSVERLALEKGRCEFVTLDEITARGSVEMANA